MGVSRRWRVFLTTFDRNHDWKCGKSLKLKAPCVRNLFHQDRRWMENSTATSWGEWGKTSGANVQTSGATTAWPCVMATLRLTRRLLCSNVWLLWIRQSSPTLPNHRTSPCDFLQYSKMKLIPNGRRFDSFEVIQTESQIATKTLTRNDFQKCFRSWKSRWNCCINAKADYFEGDGGE